ncbi:hypothetical protein [Thalassoroseus pseudoceratinae]|uniref:hypothetical protein n=1 Tax=Thalassoroseus pseudoceratinae TaxID=2713176 RepID=UPI00141EA5A5|nr:hypothetical protein [Thalassoroseus pseudoceratinae]
MRLLLAACLLVLLSVSLCSIGVFAESPTAKKTPAEKSSAKNSLAKFNGWVGEWRGVGQPQRGSRRGAWLETAEWVWDFEPEPALVWKVSKGKLIHSARLTWEPKSETYLLTVTLPNESKRTYTGKVADGQLVLESPVEDGLVHKVSFRLLNEKRMLALFETQKPGQSFTTRVAEIGYTRKGTRLAAGPSGPECIVTGGLGTIKVSFQGDTYYVCCTGCKQAFDDDPASFVEAYKQKRAEKSQREPK